MRVNSGRIIKHKKFADLDKILIYWIRNIKQYCSKFSVKSKDPDAPYWYNERATVSTFAGAVWRAGGLALEEYAETKERVEKGEPGRIDLWFYSYSKRRHYVAEAKQFIFNLTEDTLDLLEEKYSNRRDKASEQVKEWSWKGYHYSVCFLSLVFIVPRISESEAHDTPYLLRHFLNELKKLDSDVLAWCFPPAARTLKWKKSFFPGVALVAKVVYCR